MITRLRIERFKSARNLTLDCRRINVFIGKPNTGKSNILEALGMLSWAGQSAGGLDQFVRYKKLSNLFYDNLLDEPLRVEVSGNPSGDLAVKYEKESFVFTCGNRSIGNMGFDSRGVRSAGIHGLSSVRFYRYRVLPRYNSADPGPLEPPHGENLFSVIFSSRHLRVWIAELFRPFGLAIVFKPDERTIELQKQQDGVVISYPLSLSSDTLQRILFHHVAMESNKDAVLAFEEPESHSFPYYTKFLGERIAEDSSNQYFIATHNPYLLTAVLEKAKKDEVALYVVRYCNYETRAVLLNEEQINRLMEADPFLEMDGVLEAE